MLYSFNKGNSAIILPKDFRDGKVFVVGSRITTS